MLIYKETQQRRRGQMGEEGGGIKAERQEVQLKLEDGVPGLKGFSCSSLVVHAR